MDQPDLPAAEHLAALNGLRRVNRVSRIAAVLWRQIAALARRRSPLRVLDLACGGGDLPLALAQRARKQGLPLHVAACDVSAYALQVTEQRAASAGLQLELFLCDALRDDLPTDYDVITCSLFLHHLSEGDALQLLRKLRAADPRLLLIDDLIRSPFAYALAWAGCRVLTRSPVVHFDGPASVAAAFVPSEVLRLAETAGLHGATLRRHWPQRFLLSWSRT